MNMTGLKVDVQMSIENRGSKVRFITRDSRLVKGLVGRKVCIRRFEEAAFDLSRFCVYSCCSSTCCRLALSQ